MKGNSSKDQKKEGIDSGLESDGKVIITVLQQEKEEQASENTVIEDNLFFIELQGENSINRKLNRVFNIGDEVVLLKDIPHEHMYKGYLCTILSVLCEDSSPEESYYEILFNSAFKDNDLRRRSQKRHGDFEYPMSVYVTQVSGKDIVRLITQDLLYKTWFEKFFFNFIRIRILKKSYSYKVKIL